MRESEEGEEEGKEKGKRERESVRRRGRGNEGKGVGSCHVIEPFVQSRGPSELRWNAR